jgi:hypothetical protein
MTKPDLTTGQRLCRLANLVHLAGVSIDGMDERDSIAGMLGLRDLLQQVSDELYDMSSEVRS